MDTFSFTKGAKSVHGKIQVRIRIIDRVSCFCAKLSHFGLFGAFPIQIGAKMLGHQDDSGFTFLAQAERRFFKSIKWDFSQNHLRTLRRRPFDHRVFELCLINTN